MSVYCCYSLFHQKVTTDALESSGTIFKTGDDVWWKIFKLRNFVEYSFYFFIVFYWPSMISLGRGIQKVMENELGVGSALFSTFLAPSKQVFGTSRHNHALCSYIERKKGKTLPLHLHAQLRTASMWRERKFSDNDFGLGTQKLFGLKFISVPF